MKLKIKFTYKNIIHYFYILIILVNLITLFFLSSFIKKYIYFTIAPEKELSTAQGRTSEDINMNKFENIVEQLEKKSLPNNVDNINNIFD